jgi:hypothetical protein
VRSEYHNGRWILCGHILPKEQIKPGQEWMSSGNLVVTVSAVRGDWVGYTWKENGKTCYHEKDAFSFQCRYCLVLPSMDIPEELR